MGACPGVDKLQTASSVSIVLAKESLVLVHYYEINVDNP